MLFGLNAIFLHKSRGSVVNIFRDSYFKLGHFQPSVAYKSVAYKKKRVDDCLKTPHFYIP